jgi:hypothetical protein
MIETMKADPRPTHVLLMDDDVEVLPESIKRTYALLRLMRDASPDYCISGAMLELDHRNIQHEDVGMIREKDGAAMPRKPIGMPMHLWDNVLLNEQDYDCENAYAAWWYCCIPSSFITENNLPLAVFIRGDDIEYSLRNNAKLITLNSIGVWHLPFAPKYTDSLEMYLVHRNDLVIQAVSGIVPQAAFFERIRHYFWKALRGFNYSGAELLLDAVDDYLKGPDWLLTLDGEQSIKQAAQKNERLYPCRTFKEAHLDLHDVYNDRPLKRSQWLILKWTVNGHLLPGFLLKKTPGQIPYDWEERQGREYLRDKLYAVNIHHETAALRRMQRKRFFRLLARYLRVRGRYRRENARITSAYRASAEHLRSLGFWEKYLGLEYVGKYGERV